MNPEQNGGQPPINQNPYDFILNPEKPKKSVGLPGGNSLLQRIAIVGGGVVVLIILVVVVASILTAGGKEKTTDLLAIAQEQSELVRVAADGTQHATTIPAQNLAANVQTTITSDTNDLIVYLGKNGLKPTPAQLALKHSKTTDATLASAQENNSYDTAFKDIMQSDIQSYLTVLQRAYKDNPGPNGKTLLAKQFKAAQLLETASKQ